MSRRQHTLRTPVEVTGVGLHTGEETRVRVAPAPPDHGIEFVRVDIEDAPGYQNAYSQLVFAGKRESAGGGPAAAVADARSHLAQSLQKLATAKPGMLPPLVAQLNPEAGNYLQKYLQAANVSIA